MRLVRSLDADLQLLTFVLPAHPRFEFFLLFETSISIDVFDSRSEEPGVSASVPFTLDLRCGVFTLISSVCLVGFLSSSQHKSALVCRLPDESKSFLLTTILDHCNCNAIQHCSRRPSCRRSQFSQCYRND
jgi:hypothetical protein